MKTSRRSALKQSLGYMAVAAGGWSAAMAQPAAASERATETGRKSKMRIGIVTYNIAQDWTIPTIIRNCTEAKMEGVELRTTHAHGVEVTLDKQARAEVRQRFQDSPVQLMGLGSTFDFHTLDQAKLRRDIAAAKEYIVLAHDVGAGGVKVRPNGLPKEVPVEKTLEQIGRSLAELGDFGDGYGVVIRLEAHGPGTSLLPHIRKIIDVADRANVGVCWNSNQTDLEGEGFDHNFDLVKKKIFSVHMRDLYLEEYPFRKLLHRLNESGFSGFCLAEIPASTDPVRVLKYFRALWLADQEGAAGQKGA